MICLTLGRTHIHVQGDLKYISFDQHSSPTLPTCTLLHTKQQLTKDYTKRKEKNETTQKTQLLLCAFLFSLNVQQLFIPLVYESMYNTVCQTGSDKEKFDHCANCGQWRKDSFVCLRRSFPLNSNCSWDLTHFLSVNYCSLISCGEKRQH